MPPSRPPPGPKPPGREAAAPQARLGVRKTYKLFIGGVFPRSESGRSFPVTAPDGTLLANAALASRKDARDAVLAARKAFPGGPGRPPTTGARCCTGWPKSSRAGQGSSPRNPLRMRGPRRGRRPSRSRRPSTGGCGTRAGRTRWRRSPGAPPGGRPVLQPQRPRALRGRRGARPAGRGPARPGQRAGAGDRHREHRGTGADGPEHARGDPGRGAGHLRRAWRRGERADRAGGGAGPGSPGTWM